MQEYRPLTALQLEWANMVVGPFDDINCSLADIPPLHASEARDREAVAIPPPALPPTDKCPKCGGFLSAVSHGARYCARCRYWFRARDRRISNSQTGTPT